MTALLVMITFIIFLTADYLVQRYRKKVSVDEPSGDPT